MTIDAKELREAIKVARRDLDDAESAMLNADHLTTLATAPTDLLQRKEFSSCLTH